MRVLDLFSGRGGFSAPFADRGHEVVTLDRNPYFYPTVLADLSRLQADDARLHGFDVILASPPCETFSVAAIPKHWRGHRPDAETTKAIRLVLHTLLLAVNLAPRFFVLENPRGMLRKVIGKPNETVFLCAFGDSRMKPTDLWGWYPGPIARPCAPHVPAPRGSRTPGSTQGIRDVADRAKLPYGLGEELCRRMEAAAS